MLVPTCILKLIEMSLAVACISLHILSYDLTNIPTMLLCCGTFAGYCLVLGGEIFGEMTFAPIDVVMDMFYSSFGILLFGLSSAGIAYSRRSTEVIPRTGDASFAMLVSGISMAQVFIMCIDLALACLHDDEDQTYYF